MDLQEKQYGEMNTHTSNREKNKKKEKRTTYHTVLLYLNQFHTKRWLMPRNHRNDGYITPYMRRQTERQDRDKRQRDRRHG